jgi:hypothetical protein
MSDDASENSDLQAFAALPSQVHPRHYVPLRQIDRASDCILGAIYTIPKIDGKHNLDFRNTNVKRFLKTFYCFVEPRLPDLYDIYYHTRIHTRSSKNFFENLVSINSEASLFGSVGFLSRDPRPKEEIMVGVFSTIGDGIQAFLDDWDFSSVEDRLVRLEQAIEYCIVAIKLIQFCLPEDILSDNSLIILESQHLHVSYLRENVREYVFMNSAWSYSTHVIGEGL